MRYGTIAIVGRTNVGKSTFLNAALGQPLAIVSSRPQTTRDCLLGVVTTEDAQLAFVDTPGLHRPKNELGRRMNHTAVDTLREADAALLMTDRLELESVGTEPAALARRSNGLGSRKTPEQSDEELIQMIPPGLPTVLAVNKVDRLRDKARLLPLLEKMNELHPFAATVPISALRRDGVDRVLLEVGRLVPERQARFGPDDLTDRPVAFFAREYVREQVLSLASREVPHACAVTLDRVDERETGLHVEATIHVEKVGQRAIVVGAGGEMIRKIGIGARQRLAELVDQPVHLKLFVRVTERWRNVPRQLSELGYAPRGG